MSDASIINGVNVTELREKISAIEKQPKLAKFRFKANNTWLEGGHNQTVIDDFYGTCQTHQRAQPFTIDKDEPPVLLGMDKGANPVEYVLAALAGCLTTSLVYHAAARGYQIDEVESQFEGDLDLRGFLGMSDEVRNGYEGIKVTFHIKGDIPEKVKQELIQVAQQRSPVFDIVTHGVPVTVALAHDA